MTWNIRIKDGYNTCNTARVSQIGQLITAPYAFDQTSYKAMAVADTAYNYYGPFAGKQFVITGLNIKAGRDVSTTVDSVIILYEADSETSITVDKNLFQVGLTRSLTSVMTGINLLVNEGVYINGKCSDNSVAINILGYYIPKLT